MSEHDGTDDPYRTPGQPSPGQPYPGQPYPGQPYPGQPSPGQPYPGVGPDRAARPPSVVRLVQVMLAGAVVALLQGVSGLFVLDDAVEQTGAELDEVAAEAGWDPAAFTEAASSIALAVLVVLTVLSVGLWLLFARLFDRGRGQVLGTVLGAVNAATGVLALLQPADLLEWVLSAVSMALVVAGLVLLWRPASTAWFRAAAASRARAGWG